MNLETKSTCLLTLLVATMAIAANGEVLQDLSGSALPSQIKSEFEKQADAIAVAHFDYTESQSGPALPKYYGGPTVYSAFFSHSQFHLLTEYHYSGSNGKARPHEDDYDGETFYYGEPHKSNTPSLLTKFNPRDATDTERELNIYFRYPEAAGIYPVQKVSELASFKSIEPLLLHYSKHCYSLSVSNGDMGVDVKVVVPDALVLYAQSLDLKKEQDRLEASVTKTKEWVESKMDKLKNLRAMEPKRIVVFTLDPKMQYAVVHRREYTPAGQLIVDVKPEAWQYFQAANIWLPQSCTECYYCSRFELTDFSDTPILNVKFDLSYVDFEPHPEITYLLSYTNVGTYIIDRTTAEAKKRPDHKVTYVTSANGTQLRDAALDAVQDIRPKYSKFGRWLLLVFLCVPPICMMIYFYKKGGKKG